METEKYDGEEIIKKVILVWIDELIENEEN